MAHKLAVGLVNRGIEIVSGGAAGIDTAAHRGSLEAGGSTIAIFGSGLLRPYPVENSRLFDQIASQGALVSEYPTLLPPSKSTFPRRNRIVSGLSAAIVVVEAAARSGALITARLALEQGREVLAVPGPASSSRSAGANRLIQDGAKLVLEIEDVVAELPPLYRAALPDGGLASVRPPSLPQVEYSQDEAMVISLLDEIEPMHVDQLAAAVPFNIARLQTALFGLQLHEAVDLEPGRYYLRRPRKDR
jgi:DNA processing protein